MNTLSNTTETATLAGGCFWCTEAIFQRLKGVNSVISGYAGGTKNKPTYSEVSSETTGHTEAIQIQFNPKIISYRKLIEIFFKLHDPTTVNQQGNDIGTQYRSLIFYHSNNQKKIANIVKSQIEKSKIYQNVIVTEIIPYINFFKAEEYHQDYYNKNKNYSYCSIIIDPKIKKLYKDFSNEVINQD